MESINIHYKYSKYKKKYKNLKINNLQNIRGGEYSIFPLSDINWNEILESEEDITLYSNNSPLELEKPGTPTLTIFCWSWITLPFISALLIFLEKLLYLPEHTNEVVVSCENTLVEVKPRIISKKIEVFIFIS